MDIKTIFKYGKYTINVIENKKFFYKKTGITKETVSDYNIDSRILIAIEHSRDDINDFNRNLFVFDYEKFKEDNPINKALLYHEIGHLTYPGSNIEQEKKCDRFAAEAVGPHAIYEALNLAIREFGKLISPSDLIELNIRKGEIGKLL